MARELREMFTGRRPSPSTILGGAAGLLRVNPESAADARKVPDEMPMSRSCTDQGEPERALAMLTHMILSRRRRQCDHATVARALTACAALRSLGACRAVHGAVITGGFDGESRVLSAMISAYFSCGCPSSAERVFRTVADSAVTRTAMIAGLARNGMGAAACEMFAGIVREATPVDAHMLAVVLGAFGSGAIGRQLHSLAVKKGFAANAFVGNGIVNMYSKWGELLKAMKFFGEMPQRDPAAWRTMIAALASCGLDAEVFCYLEAMKAEGILPTATTFSSLLRAAGYSGSADMGLRILDAMLPSHGVAPGVEHYTAVVTMLCRYEHISVPTGLLDKLSIAITGRAVSHGSSETVTEGQPEFQTRWEDAPEHRRQRARRAGQRGSGKLRIVRKKKDISGMWGPVTRPPPSMAQ